MGTCADAFYFKNRKDYKIAVNNKKLGIQQKFDTTGCYTGILSNILYENDYCVAPDTIDILLSKNEVYDLKKMYALNSYQYEELQRLYDGFKLYPEATIVYIGIWLEC